MEGKDKSIVIGEQKNSYKVPLNLTQISMYMEYLSLNSTRDLQHIFKMLNLDSSSRNALGNTINFKSSERERRNLRSINKGLTMELFASGMFRYIDSPSEVHANCLVCHCLPKQSNDDESTITVPNNFAQGGLPDVQIDYGEFLVLLEVSAKYQPSIEHYKKQLQGALKHARSIRKEGYKKPIYCILINERSLSLVENMQAMKETLDDIESRENISITAMSIDEFANLGQVLSGDYEEEITEIVSDDLHTVLKSTVEMGVQGQFHKKLVEHLKTTTSPNNQQPLL